MNNFSKKLKMFRIEWIMINISKYHIIIMSKVFYVMSAVDDFDNNNNFDKKNIWNWIIISTSVVIFATKFYQIFY
nr:hypothetical protein [Megavirus caiporensis]